MYALLSLARITLDNLRLFLRPLFKTPYTQLPKSVREFIAGKTDCPVYQALAYQPVVEYLCDLRDCLVHYRTFATNDKLVVIGDHVEPRDVSELLETNQWFEPMARAYFGISGRSIMVNVLLPDVIFKRAEGQKKLAVFTYNERINLVAQSAEFLRLTVACILLTYSLLIEPGKPTYEFSKQKRSPNTGLDYRVGPPSSEYLRWRHLEPVSNDFALTTEATERLLLSDTPQYGARSYETSCNG
jgi:hypothetical protein